MGKRINRVFALTYWGICIPILIGILLIGDVFAGSFAVVINKSNATDNVSFSDLVKYLNAEKQSWHNGKKVVIVLRETGSEEREILLQKVYKLSEDELKKMWVGKVYRGEIAAPPKTIGSIFALIKALEGTGGGIGVVKAEEVTADVKVLKIDGKLPSDAGYPLVK